MSRTEEISDIKRKYLNQDIKKIELDTERDYFLDSTEALNYGLVDKIL